VPQPLPKAPTLLVWDEELQRQYGSLRAVEADVVLTDLDQGVRLLLDCIEARSTGRTNGMKMLVVATDAHSSSQPAAADSSTQGRTSDLLDTMRRLASARAAASRTSSPVRGGMTPRTLRRVREHIDDQLDAKVSLPDLAQVAGLSLGHFSRAFSQSVGMPPHRYVRLKRIEAAAQLIRDTDRTLADIGQTVGFSDQSHFTRVFAQVLGETPAAFRRRHR